MKGYKAFNYDWTSKNGFQYKIGETYIMNENEIELCKKGFHFCRIPIDVQYYYSGPNCKYAEIFANGKILNDDYKSVCSQIEIVKELHLEEIEELTSGLFTRIDGSKIWYRNGLLHRFGGPALISSLGYEEWRIDGIRHRSDGPAIILLDGRKEWWINGEFHHLESQ
jgi:hypothetical protein